MQKRNSKEVAGFCNDDARGKAEFDLARVRFKLVQDGPLSPPGIVSIAS
jgi:hypothetical protein